MSKDERASNLKSRVKKYDVSKKEIVKILVASEEGGDVGKNESLNAFANRVTGYDLRREVQGVYEHCNVLRAIRAKEITMTEADFDKAGKSGLIKLSSCLSSYKSLVPEVVEIIKSGKDVTNRLAAIMPTKAKKKDTTVVVTDGETKTPESPEKPKGESKESATPGAGETPSPEVSETQTPEPPKGDTYFVPEGMAVLGVEEIQARILADIRNAGTAEDCLATHEFFAAMVKEVHARWEAIEAEEKNSAEVRKVA